MAITAGNEVKFVQVSTQTKFNDITPKVAATIYWIADIKKIYLDGVYYGFNGDSDLTWAMIYSILLSENDILLDIDKIRVGDHDDYVDIEGIGQGRILATGSIWSPILKTHTVFAEDFDNLILDGGDSGLELHIGESSTSSKSFLFKGQGTIHTDLNWTGHQASQDELITAGYVNEHYVNLAEKGAANGVASLDGGGKVPSAQLPSYVDDVLEFVNQAAFPFTGEAGKIYVAQDNNKTYRWTGSAYVEISASLALGETAATAYRGDRGKTAYDFSVSHGSATDNPHAVTKAQVGLSSVINQGLATKAQAEAGSVTNVYMTPLRTKEAIDALAPKVTWSVIS